MDSKLALRKSTGPLSAGTRVELLVKHKDGTCTVRTLLAPNESLRNSLGHDGIFVVESDNLVVLRG